MVEYLSPCQATLRDHLKGVDVKGMREETGKGFYTILEELRVDAIRRAIDQIEDIDDVRAVLHAVMKTTT